MSKNVWSAICLFVFIVCLDQCTKYLIVSSFNFGDFIPVNSFFRIIFVKNTGISFGLFQHHNPILIGMVSVLLIFILYFIYVNRNKIVPLLSLVSVFAGAVGNLCDRVFHGYVVDFFDFFFRNWHWPAFNIADSSIMLGVLVYLYSSFES